jgi:hypothetical protein
MTVRDGLNITTSTLPDGQVGAPYSQTLAAVFGTQPYLWNIGTGSLPPGLSIAANGTISGTPTAPGGYSFVVTLSDSSLPPLNATQNLSITIDAGLTITTNSLPAGTPGTAYSATLQATGGTPPYTWSLATGTLPPGLVLDSDGTIVGTPTANGTYSVTIQAADSGKPQPLTATRLFSIPIGSSLLINTPSLPDAQLGTSYHQALTALNGTQPYYWTLQAGALPPGLILLASGDIVGQPNAAGTATFTVSVSDNEHPPVSASRSYTLNVNPGFAITTPSLPDGTPGVPYLTTLTAANGIPPYTWSVALGPLPSGLTLNASTGAIAGTPKTPGIFNLLIQATDSSTPQQTTNAQFTLRIDSSKSLPPPTAVRLEVE